MDKKANDRLVSYWNLVKGMMPTREYILSTILANEVRKKLLNKDDSNKDLLYTTLIETADSLGVKNPFQDKDHFQLIYDEAKQLDSSDWELIIKNELEASMIPVLPAALVDVYAERLGDEAETVLFAEAEKFVPNLHRIIDEHPKSKFVLTSMNAIYAMALRCAFENDENVEIVTTDIYRYGFLDSKFDVIFSFPIFGGRNYADDQRFICRETDMVALENLSLHLNNGGRLVITLPARVTFSAGKSRDLRHFIQTNYTIKEIAELPEGTIEHSGIRTYLLDIENTRPGDDDIIIRKYSAGERKSKRSAVESLEVMDDTFVMLDELEEQGDWNIDRIFSQQDEEYLKFQSSDVRKEMIGNVAQVFRGKSVTKKDPAGNIAVVNISNIGEYEIDYSNLDHMQEEVRRVTNYLLQEGDLLLPARGTAIRSAVFHEKDYPCIASSNVIVIRPDERLLDSTYLKIFFDSPIGNKMIKGAQQGVSVINISYKDLCLLEVPLPPLVDQQEKVKKYNSELKKYQDTISKAEKRWNEALAGLQDF